MSGWRPSWWTCTACFVALPAHATTDGTCRSWVGAEVVGRLERAGLDEVSGAAASLAVPGLYWVLSDAGGAVVYAIWEDGSDLGLVDVDGAGNDDWEDLALGPCGDDACACLYAADIGGGSTGARADGVVWRFEEPQGDDVNVGPARALRFTYPDGAHDAEALLVHPVTGEVVILTKSAITGVYTFPDVPATPVAGGVVLEHVGDIDLSLLGAADPAVTAADVSALGERVVLRTDADLLLVDIPDGGSLAGTLAGLDAVDLPEILPAPPLAGGEAVAFHPAGDRLLAVGEGEGSAVWEVRCGDFLEEATSDDLGACDAPPPKDRCGCHTVGGGPVLPVLISVFARRSGRRSRRRAGAAGTAR